MPDGTRHKTDQWNLNQLSRTDIGNLSRSKLANDGDGIDLLNSVYEVIDRARYSRYNCAHIQRLPEHGWCFLDCLRRCQYRMPALYNITIGGRKWRYNNHKYQTC